MFSKHISQITYDDVYDIVNIRKLREGYHLDYKGEFKTPDNAKIILSKELSSFANSNGGYLFWGVDKNYEISGLPATINNKPIDEWINQVISYHVDPQLFYFDPKVIQIPGSEKVIVVIHAPESTRKPHMVSEKNIYYIRVNDSSKPAKHNQIRDMFEFSRYRTMELETFLSKRNLLDEDYPMFGLNINSKSLYSIIPEKTSFNKPIILISFIPKYPQEEKINLSAESLKDWLRINDRGFYPMPDMPLYSVDRHSELKVNGIVLKQINMFQTHSYFELLNNGFIEAGYSDIMFSCDKHTKDEYEVFMYLTKLIGHVMLLMGFAKNFYKMTNYYDEVLLQLSFINVLGFGLSDLHNKYKRNFSFGRSHYKNTQHLSFKLSTWFNPITIDDNVINKISKEHSEKICRVFGLDRDYGFFDNEISF